MLERLDSREQASPRLEASSSRFDEHFSRYARTRTSSRLGGYLYPDSAVAQPAPSQGSASDPTILSSAPYWERLQRLGNARLRRQQRLAGLAQRGQRLTRLSAARRLPDVRPKSLPFLGLSGLVASQFEVLAPLPVRLEATESAESFSPQGQPARSWAGAARSQSPWSSTPYTPAKIASRSAGLRPLQRAQQRAPAPQSVVQRVQSTLENQKREVSAVAPSSRPTSRPSARDTAPDRMSRRSMKGRANPTQQIRYDYEAALPDDFLPPTRHAQGRMVAQQSGRRRGLRTAMSRSPLMAALEPRTKNTELQAPQAQARTQVQPRAWTGARTVAGFGRTTIRRTAHREVAPKPALLSSSPVRRPAMVAPSAVTTVAADRAPLETPQAMARPSSRRTSPPPMVRALKRAVEEPELLIEQPLTKRKPVASRPVQTRQGVFAPEASVLIPGAVPAQLTADAEPEVAQAQAKRSTASANAMERSRTSEASYSRPTNTVGLDEAPRSFRPNRITKTAEGTFVPQAAVLARGEDSAVLARGEDSQDRVVSARESVLDRALEREAPTSRDKKRGTAVSPAAVDTLAAARLDADPVSVTATQTRRMRPMAGLSDAEVLAPLSAMNQAEDLSQGQHAAERSHRAPTVGRSTTRVVQGFTKAVQPVATSRAAARSVAPRYFKSPLAHLRSQQLPNVDQIRVMKGSSSSLSSTSSASRVVLRPERGDDRSLAADSSPRDAQLAAQAQVETAWNRAGRPLDWTEARIDVIQVPVMMPAQAAPELARTMRTAEGSYVPVRSGQTRPAETAAGAQVTLARPDGRDPVQTEQPDLVAQTGPVDPTREEPLSRSPRGQVGAWRSGFEDTMGGLRTGAVHKDMPIWAQRSTGRPRIGGGDDLVQQLAQASAPEDVVQVLMDQSDSGRRATSTLPQPVIQVIQQIKTEAARAESESTREYERRVELPTETIRSRTGRREAVRSTTRVARGMTGLNPRGSSAGASSQAMGRVTKLAQKLQDLIAMAEGQNRSGARQQVRMAEDSGAAKAEGQTGPLAAGDTRDVSADIDTLAREVTEQVTRELEMRRERRQEDPDGRSIWW